ncbi:MAG: TetR/AcrR family transcriptional regulator [Solirubrobacteraceae bacterium]
MSIDVQTNLQADRKSTQRERLIAGMLAAAHRCGYAGANVSQVIAEAGVSRPTFYEYFKDKDDCFVATHREISRLLVWEIRRAVQSAAPEQAVQTGIRALIRLSEEFPDRAGFLCNETMAAGWRGLDEHDRLIDKLGQVVEEARAQTPPHIPTPDLPIEVVFGAGRWLLAPPMRHGVHDLSALAEEFVRWVEMYELPTGEHRWHQLEAGPALAPSPFVSEISLRPPPSIPPGRSKLSKGEIARNQHERILYATAEQAAAKGYNVTTVADITASAKVDRRVFYKHFRDKQQAFLAVHELGVQQLMTLSASAFFSQSEWPHRIWAAMRAGTQFQATHPVITHICLVESHAVGPSAIQRIDDHRAAFTIFLQEGNLKAGQPASSTIMEAIAGSTFEICYRVARRGQSAQMSRLTRSGAFIVLAPFIGPTAASAFIEAKLREEEA